jgi:hypothetical protein
MGHVQVVLLSIQFFEVLTSPNQIFFVMALEGLKLHQSKDHGELSRFLYFQGLTPPTQKCEARPAAGDEIFLKSLFTVFSGTHRFLSLV